MEKSIDSKRLAQNTLFLYVRLLFTMLVTLYTSRVILRVLGVEDFGIYNVIGGMVAMFSILSGSLTTSVSRHLTFELGRGDRDMLKKKFIMSVNVQVFISVICIVLAEIIGTWYLNTYMNLPPERMSAAHWVLQFSIFTFGINLLSVPYSASILSHEHIKSYAYIGILDVCLKLAIALVLEYSPIDKLVCYSSLLFSLALITQGIYIVYCRLNFTECRYNLFFDKKIAKELLGFAGWGFIGASSGILRSHGVNLLLNIFFGPTVNAARGIANQVNSAVNGFVGNFMTALTPQITKAYAQNDFNYLLNCIYKGSKFSFFLIYILSLPILIKTEWVLKTWLGYVPETSVAFVRLMLIFSIIDTLSRPMINANNATGDIKFYQITVGSLNLSVLPLSFVALKLGAEPEITVAISVVISLIGIVPRIYFNKKHFPISYKTYFIEVIKPTFLVSVLGAVVPVISSYNIGNDYLSFLIICVISLLCSSATIWVMGCNKEERDYAICFVRRKFVIKH